MSAMAVCEFGTFAPMQIRTPRVLVVEDDRDLRKILERAVASIDAEIAVDWATNVPEAISQLNRKAESYELVLSDFLLDEHASGFDLGNWCACHQPNLRFAMMSAYPVGTDAKGILGCRFLPKPFTLSQLREFVASNLDALALCESFWRRQ